MMSASLMVMMVLAFGWAGGIYGCPACECEDSTERPGALIINCNYRDLTEVPNFNPEAFPYYALTLVGNRISSIPDDAFAGINIEKLDLSENIIMNINSNALRGLENNMKELVLHTSRMTTFPTAAINQGQNLEKLTLKGFRLTSLPPRPFRQLTKLRELTITDSELSSMADDVFQDQSNTMTSIILHKNRLTSVPTTALQRLNNLQTLDIHENRINSLKSTSFSGLSIINLDLSQNSINTLSVSAFTPLANSLESLNLRSTNMVDSRLGGLRALVKLKHLVLDYNDIFNIPTDLMDNMRNLEYLSAQENRIEKITDQMFQGAGYTLKYLNLEDNNIQGIGNVVRPFSSLVALEELYLDGQRIAQELKTDSFSAQAKSLKTLSLSNTGFTSNDLSKIKQLESLKTLRLNTNSISSIPDMTFLNMGNLMNLFMNENKIQSISQRSLFGTQNSLTQLKLDSNQIASLGQCSLFMFNINIYNISLSSNPLICDCNLKWLKDKYDRERQPGLDFLINWECQAPANLRGRLFREVPVSDFLCNPPTTFAPCQDITPTTTTSTTTPAPTPSPSQHVATSEKPEELRINVTDITDTSLLVTWTVAGVPKLNGFLIEYLEFDSGTNPVEQYESKNARQSLVQGLLPDTEYVVCVELLLRKTTLWNLATKTCDKIRTKEQGIPVVPPPNVGVIIGATIGGIVLIGLTVILAVYFFRRYRQKKDDTQPTAIKRDVPFTFGVNGTPRSGTDSKRFARPKNEKLQNYTNEGLSDSIDGFSVEERNRIFDMLRNNRGSTLSMVSADSRNRYVPEPKATNQRPPSLPPRPQEMEGYLNPVMLRNTTPEYPSPPHVRQYQHQGEAQSPYRHSAQPAFMRTPPYQEGLNSPRINPSGYAPTNNHLYSEIPADGPYEEIPAGYIQTDSFV